MSFGLVDIGGPIDALRAKWGELPSVRDVASSFLSGVVLPVVFVAQRTFNVCKVFFSSAASGASSISTLFTGLAIMRLSMATQVCLSDLKNSVQKVYHSINREQIQNRVYSELQELSRATVATLLTVSGLLQKSLPSGLLTNHLAFLPSLGYASLFMLFILGVLGHLNQSKDKNAFEETLAAKPKPQPAPSENIGQTGETDQTKSIKKLVKFFGLKEIEPALIQAAVSEKPDMNVIFSEEWEKHKSQEIDGYLAKIAFGEELPEESSEDRALRFQENKQKFIQWTSLECYIMVAGWLGVSLSEDDLLPSSSNPITVKTQTPTPETIRSRAELLAKIFQSCFESTITTYYKKTTTSLFTASLFAMIFSPQLFIVAAPASICLLLLTLLQFREKQAQEFIVSAAGSKD